MEAAPTILVLAPMPALPASAGNRRRLVTTCETLRRGGFAIDLAYYAHEDQIYRRFGHLPPTDLAGMEDGFQRVFLIETAQTIPLKTRARHFDIDAWCPDEVGDFLVWYCAAHPGTRAVLANYVFLSRALTRVPPGVLTVIDTHDRFAGRRNQYRPFRAEPNFFYTDEAGEAAGLARADLVLAIQSEEARYFQTITDRTVLTLPPHFPPRRAFAAPRTLARIGFIGHGNDANLFSIGRFARAWAEDPTGERPELVIAGEICTSLGGVGGSHVRLAGYLDRIEEFYDQIDVVVAPMLMGTGLKMKVAEALSFGVPVIGTATGFEGFDATHPAHRCHDGDEVKARVLALAHDAAGLADLADASRDLFAGYNARSRLAEEGLVARLRERVGGLGKLHSAPVALPAREAVASWSLGPVVLTRTETADSLARTHPEHGLLVATERREGQGADPARAYAPARRRWFARHSETGPHDPGADPGIAAASLALSPEWVRDRALPPPARLALARVFAAAQPDWASAGRLVGTAGERMEIVLALPSGLAHGTYPAAAFLIAPDAAWELRLDRVTPLQTTSLGHAASGLIPIAASFLGWSGAAPRRAVLLWLSDDRIGRVDVSDEEAGP